MSETCYVVRSNDDRMLVNGSYGQLTRSLVIAKKWRNSRTAQTRCDEQNRIVNNDTITTPLRGLTFKVVPVELNIVSA